MSMNSSTEMRKILTSMVTENLARQMYIQNDKEIDIRETDRRRLQRVTTTTENPTIKLICS